MKKNFWKSEKPFNIKVSVSGTWTCQDPGEIESEVGSPGWEKLTVLAGNRCMVQWWPRIGYTPIVRSESAGRTDSLTHLPYLSSFQKKSIGLAHED